MDNKGRKWDGKSRISTDLYRQRWEEIFKKNTKKEKLKATEKFLTEVAEDHGASADDDFDQGK
tara:strand:+ start:332 stop:520 length:189 start_codon:yes stop_codon:yes gene_type:complete